MTFPPVDFEPANPDTTGRVMRFHVVAAKAPDPSTTHLRLPALAPLPPETHTRQVSLNGLSVRRHA